MGLDIRAFSKLVKIDDIADIEEWEEKYWMNDNDGTALVSDTMMDYTDKIWPGRTEGLAPSVYRVDGEKFHFRAGSYGGYNRWREWLAQLFLDAQPRTVWANPGKYQDKPFIELIEFSDSEGLIGPVVSAKLSDDFQKGQARVNAYVNADSHWEGWVRAQYAQWRRAFELAADSGLVDFY